MMRASEARWRETFAHHRIKVERREDDSPYAVFFSRPDTNCNHIGITLLGTRKLCFWGDYDPVIFDVSSGVHRPRRGELPIRTHQLYQAIQFVAGFIESPGYGVQKLQMGMGSSWNADDNEYELEVAIEDALEHLLDPENVEGYQYQSSRDIERATRDLQAARERHHRIMGRSGTCPQITEEEVLKVLDQKAEEAWIEALVSIDSCETVQQVHETYMEFDSDGWEFVGSFGRVPPHALVRAAWASKIILEQWPL